jgi:excisionase family DNA binding protein
MATPATLPHTEVRLYRPEAAAELLGISRSLLFEQIRARRIRSVKQGRLRLIPTSALDEYVQLLEREAQTAGAAQ